MCNVTIRPEGSDHAEGVTAIMGLFKQYNACMCSEEHLTLADAPCLGVGVSMKLPRITMLKEQMVLEDMP